MKRYISKAIVGCLGMCIGFALCYLTLVVSKPEARSTVITVASDGSLFLGNEQLGLSQLSAGLKQQAAPAYTITIRASKNTDYQRVAAVLDACKAAGQTKFALRTSAAQ